MYVFSFILKREWVLGRPGGAFASPWTSFGEPLGVILAPCSGSSFFVPGGASRLPGGAQRAKRESKKEPKASKGSQRGAKTQ